MSNETKKSESVISKIILYGVLTFVLVLLYVAYLITTAAANDFWERNLYKNGPFGSPSVWVSEESDLWIVSEELKEGVCQVYVYIKTDNGFDRVSFEPNKANRTVRVGIYETEPIYEGHTDQVIVDDSELFTCSAELRSGALVLSEFVETAVRPFVGERESITLTRYEYDEKIGELPFVHIPNGM